MGVCLPQLAGRTCRQVKSSRSSSKKEKNLSKLTGGFQASLALPSKACQHGANWAPSKGKQVRLVPHSLAAALSSRSPAEEAASEAKLPIHQDGAAPLQ